MNTEKLGTSGVPYKDQNAVFNAIKASTIKGKKIERLLNDPIT